MRHDAGGVSSAHPISPFHNSVFRIMTFPHPHLHRRATSWLACLSLIIAGCSSSDPTSPDGGGDPTGAIYVTSYSPLDVYALDLGADNAIRVGSGSDAYRVSNGSFVAVGPTNDLVELNANGQPDRTIVARDVSNAASFDDAFGSPQVSPDGSYVAYEGAAATSTVHVVRIADGTLVRTLGGPTNASGYFHPTWTPDGRLVMSGTLQNPGIFVTDASLTNVTRIDPNLADPETPAVRPDGALVAFISSGHVYVMGLDGQNVQQVTTGSGSESWPAWSPDGNWLAVYGLNANSHKTIFLMSMTSDRTIDVSALSNSFETYINAQGNFAHPMYWR
jgi:Tol biopolymer transport system component